MTEPIDYPDDPSTAIAAAFITNGTNVTYSFFHSWDQLMRADGAMEGRTFRGGIFAMRGGTDGLAVARNMVVKQFLAESEAHWLWWVDTDMGFAPDTLERLFEAAHPVDRPVVGALCFAHRDVEDDGMGGRSALAAPLVMDWKTVDGEQGFDVRWNYPRNTITPCDGVGSACVLIHRSVFERIQAEFGEHWYSRRINPSTGEVVSEDLSFCVRARVLGFPIHVHTGVPTTHQKTTWISEDYYWQQRALNAAPTMADGTPASVLDRTWTVPRFAIVPAHNRPQRLLALVVALGMQCDWIVVVDNASTPPVDEAKLQASVPEGVTVEVIRDEEQPPNLARFWNVMFDRCAELADQALDAAAWDVAVFNDDAVVPSGWYNLVANALREHSTAVVAHTGTVPVIGRDLLESYPFERHRRMCPWAFVVKGESKIRADESMKFWFFDDDFSRQAIDAGGVLAVSGPMVVNALANASTAQSKVLAEQTVRDRDTFVAKWGGMP